MKKTLKVKTYVFDVDGTLTPSRQTMNKVFQRWFLKFCYNHDVYLVTGSNYEKTLEQIGVDVCHLVRRIYNCNGNDVWENSINIRTSTWKLPKLAQHWLQGKLQESNFSLRTGLHFEHRPGTVNFSIVGRNATLEERKIYVAWDKTQNERNTIVKLFNKKFSNINASAGGETGIDIYPTGFDKRQIVKDFNGHNELHFFGDRMDADGNDYSLKKEIIKNRLGVCYNVQGWADTWQLLKKIQN
jgi:phosphomannomutase